MGMFDEIVVHRKLPLEGEFADDLKDVDWKELSFQTKDLDNCLSHYKLAINGYLYVQKFEDAGHFVAYNSFFDEKKSRDDMFWERVTPPRSLNFYANVYKSKFDYWVEFTAYFNSDNKLSHIVSSQLTKEDNSDRKKQEKIWQDELKAAEKRKKKFSYFLYNIIWKKPLGFCLRKIYNFTQKVPSVIMKIERKIFPW